VAVEVPSFSVENTTVEETVVIVNRILNENLPASGLKLAIWDKSSLPRGLSKKKQPATVPMPDLTEVTLPLPQRRITLALREFPVLELLKYVSAMSGSGIRGCKLGQRGDTLYLIDSDSALDLATRTYTLPPDMIEDLRAEGPERFLSASGLKFEYEGSFAKVTESGKLRIRSVPEELDLFELNGLQPDPSFLDVLKQRWSALWRR